MKKGITILLLFLSGIAIAQPLDSIFTRFCGKWDWKYTRNAWGYIESSPLEAGYTKSIIFSQLVKDSGTDTILYAFYINDTLIDNGRTYISRFDGGCGQIHANVIDEENFYPEFYDFLSICISPLDTTIGFHAIVLHADLHIYDRDTLYEGAIPMNLDLEKITVFPNPSSYFIYIDLHNMEGKVSVDVINSAGQTIITDKLVSGKITKMDISFFPKGIYYLRFNGAGNFTIRKILIM